jgi:SAM-dependent methyltransferase
LSPNAASPRSFRDPDAVLIEHGERLIRAVRARALDGFKRALSDPVVQRWMDEGKLVRTRPLSRSELPAQLADFNGQCFEHERVPFVTVPAEWAPEMLAAAGRLTLDLARELLPRGLQLKDATPANVLFRNAEPVFVDLPSIVAREATSCIWLARNQFEATFLLPLIGADELGLPIAWSLGNPVAGISHQSLAHLLGTRRWMKSRLWWSVALPAALAARSVSGGGSRSLKARSDAQARYILDRAIDALSGQLEYRAKRLAARSSHWHRYTETRSHYDSVDLEVKRNFVVGSLAATRPRRTLDIGANTGEFSEMAASQGEVVAMDVDERSVAAIWTRARARQLPILPLVANFARPSPATGWRNREQDALFSRLESRFDLVLMLAVVHHLRVTEGVPMEAQFDAVSKITRSHLLVEFVPTTDPMFAIIARGREPLYEDCHRTAFEAALGQRFEIERTRDLANGRALYLARLRTS